MAMVQAEIKLNWYELKAVIYSYLDEEQALPALQENLNSASLVVAGASNEGVDEDDPEKREILRASLRIRAENEAKAEILATIALRDLPPDFSLLAVEEAKPYAKVRGLDPLAQIIRAALTDQDLHPNYKAGNGLPFAGHCYVASELYFHLKGGKAANYKSKRVNLEKLGITEEDCVHWWVEGPDGEVIDLTAEQFDFPVPYDQGVGAGFQTKNPCLRSQKVLERIKNLI